MVVLKLKISDSNLDQLVNHLIRDLSFDYENYSNDMSILISENINIANMSSQLNMVIFKKQESFILIDIIGGGGGDGIFNINWGQERAYTKKVAKRIYKYTEEHALTVEQL